MACKISIRPSAGTWRFFCGCGTLYVRSPTSRDRPQHRPRPDVFRLRIGDYRVKYDVEDAVGTVTIFSAWRLGDPG